MAVMELDNRTSSRPVITPLVSYEVEDMLLFINNLAICCSISFLGVFTNIGNIIVFSKMGFSESSNVNFFALSVFDFFVSLLTLLTKAFYTPATRKVSHVTTPIMIVALCGSAMMTALISTERCLCVAFPLKVRTVEPVPMHEHQFSSGSTN